MNTYTHAETISAPPSGSLERVPDTGGAGGFKMIKVTPLTDAGNVRAVVEIETPNGETITGRIVKQENFRAYLVPRKESHSRIKKNESFSAKP